MASVSTYLNFPGNTENAFIFYKSVFKTEFVDFVRFGDMPPPEGMPELPVTERNMLMHVTLPTIAGHMLMATDAPESMGFNLSQGNNIYINLEPDTRTETAELYMALSADGKIEMELQDMPWGAYYASFADKFGVHWMFNCNEKI
jgi:PhnB protein